MSAHTIIDNAPIGSIVAWLASMATQVVGWPTVLLTGPVVYLIFRSYRLHVGRLDNERKHVEQVSKLHLRTIQALALAIEAKDQVTQMHLNRVSLYASELGHDLGMSDEELEGVLGHELAHVKHRDILTSSVAATIAAAAASNAFGSPTSQGKAASCLRVAAGARPIVSFNASARRPSSATCQPWAAS